jgi:hypothetical protein
MAKEDLEKKVKEATVTKDILKNFSYLSSAYTEVGKKDGEGVDYVATAVDKVMGNVSAETKHYMEGLSEYILEDYQKNGTFTNKTVDLLGKYSQLYDTKYGKANLKEITSCAKEMGYNEEIPAFLNGYMNESFLSLIEQNKEKLENTENPDNQLIAALKAYEVFKGVTLRKAHDNIMDTVTKKRLDQLAELYQKKAEQKKTAQETQ